MFKIQAWNYISFSFCSLWDHSLLFMSWTGNYSLQFPAQSYHYACILTWGVGSSLFFMPDQSLASFPSYQETVFLMQYCQIVTKLKQLNGFAHGWCGNDFRLSSESLQNPLAAFWSSWYPSKDFWSVFLGNWFCLSLSLFRPKHRTVLYGHCHKHLKISCHAELPLSLQYTYIQMLFQRSCFFFPPSFAIINGAIQMKPLCGIVTTSRL